MHPHCWKRIGRHACPAACIVTTHGSCLCQEVIDLNTCVCSPFASPLFLPGVDIALFEIFKQHLLDKEKEKGKESPPRLKLFAAGMLSSSIAQLILPATKYKSVYDKYMLDRPILLLPAGPYLCLTPTAPISHAFRRCPTTCWISTAGFCAHL
eukprot:1148937-Pelagomonas_calceolata.AAC.7